MPITARQFFYLAEFGNFKGMTGYSIKWKVSF
jgi:hypothetical protein